MKTILLFVAAAALLLLAGCACAESAASTDKALAYSKNTFTAPTTYTPHTLNTAEKTMRANINKYRIANGLPTYNGSAPLNAAAHDFAVRMRDANAVTLPTYIQLNGYTGFDTCGYEAVGAIGPDRNYVLNTWKADPVMNGVLLNLDCTLIGLAYVNGDPALYGGVTPRYWLVIVRTPQGYVVPKWFEQESEPGVDASGSPVPVPVGSPSYIGPGTWGGEYEPLPPLPELP